VEKVSFRMRMVCEGKRLYRLGISSFEGLLSLWLLCRGRALRLMLRISLGEFQAVFSFHFGQWLMLL